MPFDGLVTKSISEELNNSLIGGKITKIYEPNKNEVILVVYANSIKYSLLINISPTNYSMHLTTNSKPNPLSAPNFCMVLRKYLIGCKIKSINTTNFERIITIELEGYNELNDLTTKKLIVELMGKHSNIILVDNQNIIIDSLRHLNVFANSSRNILPGQPYLVPLSNKIDITTFSLDDYSNLSGLNKLLPDVFVQNFTGISKGLIEFIIETLNINAFTSKESFSLVYNFILEIIKNIPNNVSCVFYKKDYVLTINANSNPFAVNFFLDDFYFQKEQQEEFVTFRNNMLSFILNKLKKIGKKLDTVNIKLEECSNKELYQLYGELLTNNLYKISDDHLNKIVLENYYNNNTFIEIPLDVTLSPANNAKKYFHKYNKLKNAEEIVNKQKVEISTEIEYLESIVYELENANSFDTLTNIYEEISEVFDNQLKISILEKDFSNEKLIHPSKESSSFNTNALEPMQFNIDGYVILVGKNNKQNDYLTTKIARGNDLWFHTKNIQGSHTILKIENGTLPTQTTINKVASLSAYYSKACNSSNVAVDYTFAKYIKKPSKSKPGMVIYTNYQTVNVHPKLITS